MVILMSSKKKKISAVHIFRRVVQTLAFLVMPGLFVSAFYAIKDLFVSVKDGSFTIRITSYNVCYTKLLRIPQKDYVNKIIEGADLVITVGYDIVEYAPNKWNSKRDLAIIHIDRRPAHINKFYQPLVDVVGEITDSLERLTRRVSPKGEPDWALEVKKKMAQEHYSYENDDCYPMKPQKILIDVRKVLGDDRNNFV